MSDLVKQRSRLGKRENNQRTIFEKSFKKRRNNNS